MRWKEAPLAEHPQSTLHVDVWTMSLVRDHLLASGASFTESVPLNPSLERRTARSPFGRPGIPAYKLASPDGWLILPEELDEAMERIDATDDPAVKEVLEFLDLGRTHAGVIVE